MTEQDPKTSALAYLVGLVECYLKTLPPPVAGPVAAEAQKAIDALKAEAS